MIALQLDLARQFETPDYIRRCFDFAAEFGYNTVFLYLEDRVRTKSYPYIAKEESYDLQTMRGLLSHAADVGLELIPVVSTLGHVERFLEHPEMKHLSEIREGVSARLGNEESVICPVLEESDAFWNTYLAEVADIFPSPYFHIGCDEVWNLGLCPRCQAEIQKGRSVGDLFAHHVSEIHKLLNGLGKRVIIWDEMLEEYPKALYQIPSDVILCVWQYSPLIERTMNHFGNRTRDHRLTEYDRLGMAYLIAPTSWNILNTISFTDYGRHFKPAGFVMTRWEGNFLEEEAQNVAFAGRFWSKPNTEPREIFTEVIFDLFGDHDRSLVHHLWTKANASGWPIEKNVGGLLGSPTSAYANEYRNSIMCGELAVSPFLKKELKPMGRELLEDILATWQLEKIQFDLRDSAQRILRDWAAGREGVHADMTRALSDILKEIDGVIEYWDLKWGLRRPGIPNRCGTHGTNAKRLRIITSNLLQAAKEDNPPFQGFLKVRFSLPDYYGLPLIRWSAVFDGETEWTEIYRGSPKVSFRDYSDCPFFFIGIPVESLRCPKRLKIEYSGYCGIGLLYLEYFMNGKVFRPVSVENSKGTVTGEENVLIDNTLPCGFGETSAIGAFQTSEVKLKTHSLEIVLGEANTPLP